MDWIEIVGPPASSVNLEFPRGREGREGLGPSLVSYGRPGNVNAMYSPE